MSDAPPISAFLDASVLYPALLRDILLRLALRGVYRARWSAAVQDEWVSALIRNRTDIPLARIERTRRLMDARIIDAVVDGYEPLIETVTLPDRDDRHVLAAAIHCGAGLIVTANLRDFPAEILAPHKIEPRHPDAFILALLQASPIETIDTLRRLRVGFESPSMTAPELLGAISRQGLTATAEKLREFADSL